MFYFAEKTNILVEDLVYDKKHTYRTIMFIILLMIAVTLLSYFVSDKFQALYLLMPVYSSIRAVRHENVKINNQRTSIEHLLKEPVGNADLKKEDKALVGTLAQQFSAQSEESLKTR